MLLQKEQGSIKVTIVELIGHTPSDRPKLPSLLNDAVQEGNGIEECSPLLVIHLKIQTLHKYTPKTHMDVENDHWENPFSLQTGGSPPCW